MVDVYLHYYIRYNYMFWALDNSHLQVVHESLESSYKRFNMGCVQWGYFLRIHVQPEDGCCQDPKHVVVP